MAQNQMTLDEIKSANGKNPAAHKHSLDLQEMLKVLRAVRSGNFSVRLSNGAAGEAAEVIKTLNEIIELNKKVAGEIHRIRNVVGEEGNINQRVVVRNARGSWLNYVNSVNALIADLIQPTEEVTRVIGAVATGDLSKRIALKIDGKPLKGGYLRTATTINTMVDQLSAFSSEVTRVAREVGTEGKLGGQAVVKGVSGTWKDLTDNVNQMASNLTAQVRNIADVSPNLQNPQKTLSPSDFSCAV